MDYFSTHFNFPKIENPFGYDCLYYEQQLPPENQILELPPLQTIYEPNLSPLSHHDAQLTNFQDFEDFGYGFLFDNAISSTIDYGDTMVDEKPQTNYLTTFEHNTSNHDETFTSDICTEVSRMVGIREIYASLDHKSEEANIISRPKIKRCAGLELGDIQKYFDVPIKEAAKELGIGVTRLKKRCRELSIMRWPHRKFRSLKYLISNVKKMGVDRNDLLMLEEQKKILEETPNSELTLKAKKLRQACFKANYKNKRLFALGHQ